MRRCRHVALWGAIFLCVSTNLKALADIVDQSQEVLTQLSAAPAFSPMGQSFVPTLNGLDWIELGLTDATTANSSATLSINVREATIDGAILGTSMAVVLEDCFNRPEGPGCNIAGGSAAFVRFDFPTTVPLVPGNTHVFEIVHSAEGFTGVGNASDRYANGTAFFDGQPRQDRDLYFREGIIPEPASLMLMVAGAFGLSRRAGRQPA